MKVWVVIEDDIESSTVRAVTLSADVAAGIELLDSTLRIDEWKTVGAVPERTIVYVVAGEPGEEPVRINEIPCWPWESLLTYTIEPRIMDHRVDRGLLPPGLHSTILSSFGVPGPHPPPPTIVVQCQDRDRAIATYRVQAGL
jgi:hypothetical protein